MGMSKKDYVAIADRMNMVLWKRESDPATMTDVISQLAVVFEADNPRFDRARFIAACTSDAYLDEHTV
jgi:hypothetical protein